LIVAAVGQELLNKLMDFSYSLHEDSLKMDEEQARKKSQVLDKRVHSLRGFKYT
jgi:hypothetical protein